MKFGRSIIVFLAVSVIACSKNQTPAGPTTTACGYALASTNQAAPAGGGSFAVTLTKTSGSCTWTATTDATWITLSGPTTGTDTATITYTVAANPSTAARTAVITIQFTGGSVQHAINEAGSPAPAGCTYAIAPTTQAAPLEGGNFSANVTATGSGCSWTASSSASWLTLTSGTSGNASGPIGYSVAANPDAVPRTGTITVQYSGGTVQLQVTQAPVTACVYTLSPPKQDAPFGGGSFTFTATRNTPNGCSWSASTSTPWITITSSPSGNSPGVIAYTVAPNTSPTTRTGTISVIWSGGNADFTVTQSGVACTFTVAPPTQAVAAAGGFFSAAVTASDSSCTWTAAPDVAWMSIASGGSGTGNGTVVYVVLTNGTGSSRTGNVVITGGNNAGTAQVAVTQSP